MAEPVLPMSLPLGDISKLIACVVKYPLAGWWDAYTSRDMKRVGALGLVIAATAIIRHFNQALGNAILLLIAFYVILFNANIVETVIKRVFKPYFPEGA